MPYQNSYYDDEEGGSTIRWPWGTEEEYSDVMGRGDGAENYPTGPESKYSYPVTTGIYGTQPSPSALGMGGNQPSASLGSRPFTISSGGGGKVPGKTWGAGGETGAYMTAPTMGPMPTFNLPTWDESKIAAKAQRVAGPGLRELRKGIREAQGRYYENPNVRRMTLRDAMAGYGMGLERVMGGARKEATAEYAAEYGPQVAKAGAEYQGQVQQTLSQYQNAWKEYLYRMTNR